MLRTLPYIHQQSHIQRNHYLPSRTPARAARRRARPAPSRPPRAPATRGGGRTVVFVFVLVGLFVSFGLISLLLPLYPIIVLCCVCFFLFFVCVCMSYVMLRVRARRSLAAPLRSPCPVHYPPPHPSIQTIYAFTCAAPNAGAPVVLLPPPPPPPPLPPLWA